MDYYCRAKPDVRERLLGYIASTLRQVHANPMISNRQRVSTVAMKM